MAVAFSCEFNDRCTMGKTVGLALNDSKACEQLSSYLSGLLKQYKISKIKIKYKNLMMFFKQQIAKLLKGFLFLAFPFAWFLRGRQYELTLVNLPLYSVIFQVTL